MSTPQTLRAVLTAAVLLAGSANSLLQAQSSTTDVVASNLQAPSHVHMTPRGNLLVVESGAATNAGRISMVTPSGARRSVIEGLPAAIEGQGDYSGPQDAALMGRNLYVVIGGGDVEGSGPTPGTVVPNPKGISSILFSSLLRFTLSNDIDAIQGSFTLTPSQHQTLWDGETLRLRNSLGEEAEVEMVVDFRDTVPDARSIYRGSNPYAINVGPDGTAWIADASLDAIYRVDLRSGRARIATRFESIPNPLPIGPPRVDAVPNSVVPFGDGFLVTQLSGFPFASGTARIQHYNPRTGTVSPFINGLTMALDVAVMERPQQRPRFYVIEFSTNLLATPPAPGRLTVYDSPEGRVVKADLVTPTSIALDPRTGDAFITERATGRLLRVRVTP